MEPSEDAALWNLEPFATPLTLTLSRRERGLNGMPQTPGKIFRLYGCGKTGKWRAKNMVKLSAYYRLPSRLTTEPCCEYPFGHQ